MKKIDLHLHTVPSKSEASFSFDLSILKEYVKARSLDAIAVTNHNRFDLEQYRDIAVATAALALPGIEIDIEGGHLLMFADPTEVVDFDGRCSQVSKEIKDPITEIDLATLRGIFPDLGRYLLIPHYDKKPAIPARILEILKDFIRAGEVTSPKKFVYCMKDATSLVPVFFSDERMRIDLFEFPIRQTFVDIGDISFQAIKYALADKNKVSLTIDTGHRFFQALGNGLILSTGLNVIIGERSSGKSYTLDRLKEKFDRVKYIRQFSLLEHSDKEDSERFNAVLRSNQSLFVQDFLKEFKQCIDDMSSTDIEKDDRSVDQYLSALLKHAQESERADAFSKTVFFAETEFAEESLDSLQKVIDSVMVLSDTEEYRSLIEKYVPLSALKELAINLMEHFAQDKEYELKKRWVNDLISSVKAELQRRTAATPIPEIDLYGIALNRNRVQKFSEVVALLRQEREIFSQDVQAFRIVAKTKPFAGAGELKNHSGRMLRFAGAFQEYDRPYDYLKQLRLIEELSPTEFYKFFTAIDYRILNRLGFEVSGGERSEFRLLQEISDALQYDMLLIDEPESSFDNIFLNSEVNQLIKDISKKMPVVLVTHSSTVGASIKPDYIIFTVRFVSPGLVEYKVFFGHPTDKLLRDVEGNTQPNHEAILNCLEAGIAAYNERGVTYETLKN